MTFRLLASCLIITSLSFISCSDSPTSIGSDLLKQDFINVKTLDSQKDSISQHSSYFKKSIPLASSTRLILGKHANVESSILIRFFFAFPDSISNDLINNDVNVTSSWVELTKNYIFGSSSAAWDYTVHKINSNWLTGFDGDSLSTLNYDAADVSSGHTSTADSLFSFSLDNQLVQNWMLAAADTSIPSDNGIIIKPTATTDRALGFYALSLTSTVGIPELKVVLEKPGVYLADTLTFVPTIDLSAVTGSVPNNMDMVIQGGLVINSKLYFDISSVPKNAIVNFAQLTLTADTTQTIGSLPSTINAYFITDSTTNVIDSQRVAQINVLNNLFIGDISSYVKDWVKNQNNQGLLLSNSNELGGLDLAVIKGSSSQDASVRPKLKIVYTVKE